MRLLNIVLWSLFSAAMVYGGALDDLKGEKIRFDCTGHEKAKGVRIFIEYPSTWKAQEGRQPNVVQRFSPPQKVGRYVETVLLIKSVPEFTDSSRGMADNDVILEILSGLDGPDMRTGMSTIGGETAGWAIFTQNKNHAGLELTIKNIMYVIIHEGKVITFTGSAGGLQSDQTISQTFNAYYPVFQIMASSIVFPDKWEIHSSAVPEKSTKTALYPPQPNVKEPEEQFKLGYQYFAGQGVPKDEKEAVKWFTKAAEQGHAQAQFFLGLCCQCGFGIPKNYKEAVRWFTESAEQGYSGAAFFLGILYCTEGTGLVDDKEAARWFAKGAEQGNEHAQCMIGRLYYTGQGVLQDYKEAVKWFSKAAEQGNAEAQGRLGTCYYRGEGVSRDFVKAYALALHAAKNGEPELKEYLAERLTPEQIAKGQKRAKELMMRMETSKE